MFFSPGRPSHGSLNGLLVRTIIFLGNANCLAVQALPPPPPRAASLNDSLFNVRRISFVTQTARPLRQVNRPFGTPHESCSFKLDTTLVPIGRFPGECWAMTAQLGTCTPSDTMLIL